MKLVEHDVDRYRIYAGAMEGSHADGFIAAVVVVRLHSGPGRQPRAVFRDDALACGHRWPTADLALAQAVQKGTQVIEKERGQSVRMPCPIASVPDRASTGTLVMSVLQETERC